MDPKGIVQDSSRAIASAEDPAIQQTAQLNVITFNIWRTDKWDRFPSFVAALKQKSSPIQNPDFILLQEVMAQSRHEDESTAHFLGRMLGMHTAFIKRTNDTEGIAILSRYPIESTRYKKLFYSPKDPYERIALAVTLNHPLWGKTTAMSIHLASERENHEIRRKQLEDLKTFIDEFKYSDTLIVGGDFNAWPVDQEIKDFQRHWAEQSLRRFKQSSIRTEPTWSDVGMDKDFNWPEAERLDYIFMASNKEFKFKGEERLFINQVPSSPRIKQTKRENKVWVSDHLPVWHSFDQRN